jgi:hypothetical protein
MPNLVFENRQYILLQNFNVLLYRSDKSILVRSLWAKEKNSELPEVYMFSAPYHQALHSTVTGIVLTSFFSQSHVRRHFGFIPGIIAIIFSYVFHSPIAEVSPQCVS